MIAYLSGAMEYDIDEGRSWRSELTVWLHDKLDIDVIDPVAETARVVGEQQAGDYRAWKKTDIERYRRFVRQFVEHDTRMVTESSDFVICLWNEATARGGGTHGELTVAYLNQVPVYLVHSIPADQISGWILACATELFSSMESLRRFLLLEFDRRT